MEKVNCNYSVLSSYSELLSNEIIIQNAEKKFGFNLLKIASRKYEAGFYYAIRYKDFKTGKWLPLKKSSNTSDEKLAKIFAIENKEKIIAEYNKRKANKKTKIDTDDFYQMLEDYYKPDSKYLKDDAINNRKQPSEKDFMYMKGALKNHFIPFLRENNINHIWEITSKVYSDLKQYLKGKVSVKTANNCLNYFNRILQYHERNGFIPKLPYSLGTGNIRKTYEDNSKTKENQPNILPIELLKNIVDYIPNEKESYLLSIIGLTTGMRNSEIARIKGEDVIYIESKKIYILKVYNEKTKQYHKNETDIYRKYPLHPFVVKYLKEFISGLKPNECIFNKIYFSSAGYPCTGPFSKAATLFYSIITKKPNDKDLKDTMKKENISFYSFRHTFNTLFQLHLSTKENNDLIDYFTGHKISNAMRANYSHINTVNNEIFYDTYGKVLIEMLDKFIFN